MKFVSTHPTSALSFDLDGQHYDVPVGGTCDVPDRIAFSVKLVGLPLEPLEEHLERMTAPEKPAAAEPTAQAPTAPEKPEPKSSKK